jgi:hypothetical protein
VRQWREIDPAEEMVHDGVANDHDGIESDVFTLRRCEELREQSADRATELPDQLRPASAFESGLNAGHHVAAVTHLGVERGPDGQDLSGLEVEKLRDNGGGTEIDGYAQTGAGREPKTRVVHQHDRIPLPDL